MPALLAVAVVQVVVVVHSWEVVVICVSLWALVIVHAQAVVVVCVSAWVLVVKCSWVWWGAHRCPCVGSCGCSSVNVSAHCVRSMLG